MRGSKRSAAVCSKTIVWPLAPRSTAGARNGKPLRLLAGRRQHGDELADAQPLGLALDGEMHRDRLAAVGQARALEGERQRAPFSRARRGSLRIGEKAEGQRLDPQPRRIDDLEDDGVGFGDLAGDRVGRGDDAGDRRDQPLGLAARLVERGAALPQALELEDGFVERDLGHGAGLGERLVARDALLDDADLLIELARPSGACRRRRWPGTAA